MVALLDTGVPFALGLGPAAVGGGTFDIKTLLDASSPRHRIAEVRSSSGRNMPLSRVPRQVFGPHRAAATGGVTLAARQALAVRVVGPPPQRPYDHRAPDR